MRLSGLLLTILLFALLLSVSSFADEKPEIFVQEGPDTRAAAFSSDGKYALSGSSFDNNSVSLWDIETGREIKSFKTATEVQSLAFSPDMKHIVTINAIDNKSSDLTIWEFATGKRINSFRGPGNMSKFILFSPDGNYVLSGSGEERHPGILILWDAFTGEKIKSFKGHSNLIASAAFSSDGKSILSGSLDGTIRLWDVKTGKEIQNIKANSYGSLIHDMKVAFIPNSNNVLQAGIYNEVNIWEITSGKKVKTEFDSSDADAVAFSPSGKYASFCIQTQGSGQFRILDVYEVPGEKIKWTSSIDTGRGGQCVLGFGDDGKHILVAEGDAIQIFDANTGQLIKKIGHNSTRVDATALNKDGKLGLAAVSLANAEYAEADNYAGFNGRVVLWDLEKGNMTKSFDVHTAKFILDTWFTSAVINRQNTFAAFGIKQKYEEPYVLTKLVDLQTGATKELPGIVKGLSPDGNFIIVNDYDWDYDILFTLSGEPLWKIDRNSIREVAEKQLLTHDEIEKLNKIKEENEIKVEKDDISLLMKLAKFNLDNKIFVILPESFSPDGRYVVVQGAIRTSFSLLDLKNLELAKTFKASIDISPEGYGLDELLQLEILVNGINSAVFSRDGKLLLTGGDDKIVKLWDVSNAKEIKAFIGHDSKVHSVAFSSDEKRILSLDYSGIIKEWNIADGTEIISSNSPFNWAVMENPDLRYVMDGSSLLDINTGEEIARFISFADSEWIVITPEGYYNSSQNGHKYLNIRKGSNIYGIDQFYDVFYRPDIVAAKLKGEDISSLITLTIDEAVNNPPPSVEFTSVPSDTDESMVKVCYQAISTGGGIGEMRLFHNGKLIQSDGFYKDLARISGDKTQLSALNSRAIYDDMRNVKVKDKSDPNPVKSKYKGDAFSDCTEIEPVSGENDISVTAFNRSNTVQSYMKTISFDSKVKQSEPHLYILSIGINKYKDSEASLKYAVKDAVDMKDKLIKQAATIYKTQNIHYEFLADATATKVNIINRIDELSKTIMPGDSFVFFAAGHGVLLQNQYYMITQDYDGQADETSMISSNEIVEMSKKIKSLSQLFIFDTCHAGGVDNIVSGLYDARMSVLAKKMGLHIYASANSIQEAMDGYNGNGLFTYTLLAGLNDNKDADENDDTMVSLIELGEYSKRATSRISRRIGHSQTPLIINFGKDNALYNLTQ